MYLVLIFKLLARRGFFYFFGGLGCVYGSQHYISTVSKIYMYGVVILKQNIGINK